MAQLQEYHNYIREQLPSFKLQSEIVIQTIGLWQLGYIAKDGTRWLHLITVCIRLFSEETKKERLQKSASFIFICCFNGITHKEFATEKANLLTKFKQAIWGFSHLPIKLWEDNSRLSYQQKRERKGPKKRRSSQHNKWIQQHLRWHIQLHLGLGFRGIS